MKITGPPGNLSDMVHRSGANFLDCLPLSGPLLELAPPHSGPLLELAPPPLIEFPPLAGPFQSLSPLSVPLLCLFLHIGVDEYMSFICSRVDLMLSSSYTNSKIVITMYLVYLYHVGPNYNIVRVVSCNAMLTDHCITELLV